MCPLNLSFRAASQLVLVLALFCFLAGCGPKGQSGNNQGVPNGNTTSSPAPVKESECKPTKPLTADYKETAFEITRILRACPNVDLEKFVADWANESK
jgi:ABC-type uncharacterized transport system auxiliary subunit